MIPEWSCSTLHSHDWDNCSTCLTNKEKWMNSPEPDFERASGLCECPTCGKQYYDHPAHPVFKFLKVTCDGRIWKL